MNLRPRIFACDMRECNLPDVNDMISTFANHQERRHSYQQSKHIVISLRSVQDEFLARNEKLQYRYII